MESNSTNNGSILDMILEKCANTEQSVHLETVRKGLHDAIRTHAKREKALRESTITIKSDEAMQLQQISEIIEKEWSVGKKQAPATYWADKSAAYVQFISKEVKNSFLDFATTALNSNLKEYIAKPNQEGEHITRRPIRIVMTNVRANIKLTRIMEILRNILSSNDQEFEELREGKPNATQARNIMFQINGEAFKVLFGMLDGALPYTNAESNTKIRLFMKVNCRPWTCRECYAIGNHQCEGRVCGQCGLAGHATKDCKQKTKFCRNCKRRGHRSKDVHCPVYLNEIAKEIRKVAIPIEYFEDKELRFNLAKHIQLK